MEFAVSILLVPLFILAQSCHISPQISIIKILELSFSEGFTFIHHELNEEISIDTLSYEFYSPKVQIEEDILYISFIQKIKEYGTEITVEKIEQTIPLSCIEKLNTFNFTFGVIDHFEPPPAHLGFWVDEEYSQTKVYGINLELWKNNRFSNSDYELLHTIIPYVAKFPASMSRNVLLKLRRNLKLTQKP